MDNKLKSKDCCSKCPNCGEHDKIEWEKQETPDFLYGICKECGQRFTEYYGYTNTYYIPGNIETRS